MFISNEACTISLFIQCTNKKRSVNEDVLHVPGVIVRTELAF